MIRVRSLSSSEKVLRNEPDFYTMPDGGGRIEDNAPPWIPPSMATMSGNSSTDLPILEPTPIAPQHRHTQSAPSLAMTMPAPDAAASSSVSLPSQPFAFAHSMQGQEAAAALPSTGPAFFEAFFREGFMSHLMASASTFASAPGAEPSHANLGLSFPSVLPSHQVSDRSRSPHGKMKRRV
jgi:hypothetical protein